MADTYEGMMIEANTNPYTFQRVINERLRQEKKWGHQNHDPSHWLGILGEEFGEVCKAVIEEDAVQIQKELCQVAAVAVAMVDSIERNQR